MKFHDFYFLGRNDHIWMNMRADVLTILWLKTNWRESIKFCSMEINGNYYIKRTHVMDLLVGTNIYQYEEDQMKKFWIYN